MTKIIRTPTKATGGITEAEREAMKAISDDWIKEAFRTDPVDPREVREAIAGLYAAAGLKAPRVVVAPSPLVMAFAYGAAAAIWYGRGSTAAATYDATEAATAAATCDATYAATHAATDVATRAATRVATYDATEAATDATDVATRAATRVATRDATNADAYVRSSALACVDLAGGFGLRCAAHWWRVHQGGNMWAGTCAYLHAARDVLGLDLPMFAPWERAARAGGFRVLHPEFCIVSDRPEVLRRDDQNRPHCEDGPSHRWRDGWSLYHWHGVRVPSHWIERRADLDPAEVLRHENVEVRAAGMEIVGWAKALDVLDAQVIDSDPDQDHGDLIELTLPGLDEPGRFLRAYCPRNGLIVEGAPRISDIDGMPINTVKAAQAWSFGMTEAEFTYPTAVS